MLVLVIVGDAVIGQQQYAQNLLLKNFSKTFVVVSNSNVAFQWNDSSSLVLSPGLEVPLNKVTSVSVTEQWWQRCTECDVTGSQCKRKMNRLRHMDSDCHKIHELTS